jgi:alpha(1,3/1,4) fucosyltransferase
MNIAIIPSQNELLNDEIFDIKNGRDNVLERFALLKDELEKKGHFVRTIDKFEYDKIDLVIFQVLAKAWKYLMQCIKANPKIVIVNYATEPTIIHSLNNKIILNSSLFDYVLTWNDNLIDHKKFVETRSFAFNKSVVNMVQQKDKQNLCVINYNKKSNQEGEIYSEREKVIEYFGKNGEIDLYGYGWENHPNEIIRKVYLGPIKSKIDVLKNYRYSIAFENVNNEPGYICEKMFDSFSAGCIPIFYGAPNVTELIPKNTFINYQDFKNLTELEIFLESIDEKKYSEYLSYINDFVNSVSFRKYSSNGFVDSVNNIIDKVDKSKISRKNILKIKCEFIKKMIQYPNIFINDKRFLYNYFRFW